MIGEDGTEKAAFRCCCGCVHMRTAAAIIGVVELVYVSVQLGSLISSAGSEGRGGDVAFVLTLSALLLALLAVALLFAGLWRHTHALLIPHLLMQVIAILIFASITILCLIALVSGTGILLRISNTSGDENSALALSAGDGLTDIPASASVFEPLKWALAGMMAVFLLATLFQLWFLYIVVQAFRFLRFRSQAVQAGHLKKGGERRPLPRALVDSAFPLPEHRKPLE